MCMARTGYTGSLAAAVESDDGFARARASWRRTGPSVTNRAQTDSTPASTRTRPCNTREPRDTKIGSLTRNEPKCSSTTHRASTSARASWFTARWDPARECHWKEHADPRHDLSCANCPSKEGQNLVLVDPRTAVSSRWRGEGSSQC